MRASLLPRADALAERSLGMIPFWRSSPGPCLPLPHGPRLQPRPALSLAIKHRPFAGIKPQGRLGLIDKQLLLVIGTVPRVAATDNAWGPSEMSTHVLYTIDSLTSEI